MDWGNALKKLFSVDQRPQAQQPQQRPMPQQQAPPQMPMAKVLQQPQAMPGGLPPRPAGAGQVQGLRTPQETQSAPFKMFEDNSFQGDPSQFRAQNPRYTFYEDNSFSPPPEREIADSIDDFIKRLRF